MNNQIFGTPVMSVWESLEAAGFGFRASKRALLVNVIGMCTI